MKHDSCQSGIFLFCFTTNSNVFFAREAKVKSRKSHFQKRQLIRPFSECPTRFFAEITSSGTKETQEQSEEDKLLSVSLLGKFVVADVPLELCQNCSTTTL